MKTLKLMLAGIALLFTSIAANATVKPHDQPSQNDVVNMYVNAITTGSTVDLGKILDNEMQFNIMRGENTTTLNKAQLLDYLKNNTVTTTAVTTKTTVLTDDGNAAKIKVEFKYSDYTRTDVITLTKSGNWKIANVDSTFK
jgi:Putative lumazine-binding